MSKALTVTPVTLVKVETVPAEPPKAHLMPSDLGKQELGSMLAGLHSARVRHDGLSGICCILAGIVCEEAKDRLEHGDYKPWLKAHLGKSAETARQYRAIAKAFLKSQPRLSFAQMTLALGDGANALAEQSLDLTHPVVGAVAKWANGKTFYQLREEHCGDGRANNKPGFVPNMMMLRAWLKQEYPDNPEYHETQVFTALPEEIQKRFKKEGERYEKRLTDAQKAEIQRAADAKDWLERMPGFLASGLDHGLDDFGSVEALKKIADLAGDLKTQITNKLARRAAVQPKTTSK